MTTTLEYGGGFLPNVRATLARSSNERVRPIIGLARTNRELSAALSRLDGYEATVAQIEALPAAVDSWTTGMPATNEAAADVIVAALEDGDVAGVPEAVAATQAKVNAVIEAVNAADRLASQLVQRRDGIVLGGADELLATLDGRMRETVAALSKNAAIGRGIVTADEAIDAGLVKDWKAAAELHRTARHIRAAQAALLQIEHRDFLNSLDDRVRVAVTELEQWESVEPRLPQVVRHDGLWKIEKHKHRPENMAERWTVPWPADPDARLAWLALNHPASVRVPSIEDMQAAHKRFTHEAARTTATGERIEPQRMSAEHLGQREQVGAVR